MLAFSGFLVGGWTGQVVANLGLLALVFTIAIQLLMFTMVAASVRVLKQPRREVSEQRLRHIHNSPMPLGLTAVMPAYNEEAVIVMATRSILSSDYPDLRVIVVNDGSTDRTLELLIEEFSLLPVECEAQPFPELTTNPVRSLYKPIDPSVRLWVIDKEPGGNKASSANVGIAAAETPYVFICDSDSLIEGDALGAAMAELHSAHPRLVGVGGTILPVNGCEVDATGAVTRARVPRSWLAGFQLVEYLRSFVVARTAFGSVRASVLISGAFGVYSRSDLLRVGGLIPGHLGEDFDLTVRVQRYTAEHDRPAALAQVPEAIVWTEVPESLAVLRRQRIRWHRGLHQTLKEHRVAVGNPRYGRFGTVGLGYMAIFEWAAPIIEVLGYAALGVAVITNNFNASAALLFLAVAVLASWAVSCQSIWMAERYLDLYRDNRALARLMLLGLLEPLGYRQMTLAWRIRSLFGRKRPSARQWGEMNRIGFGQPIYP